MADRITRADKQVLESSTGGSSLVTRADKQSLESGIPSVSRVTKNDTSIVARQDTNDINTLLTKVSSSIVTTVNPVPNISRVTRVGLQIVTGVSSDFPAAILNNPIIC